MPTMAATMERRPRVGHDMALTIKGKAQRAPVTDHEHDGVLG
jgi:hypothetical protein